MKKLLWATYVYFTSIVVTFVAATGVWAICPYDSACHRQAGEISDDAWLFFALSLLIGIFVLIGMALHQASQEKPPVEPK